jgi:peptide/nickel transport system permease protein
MVPNVFALVYITLATSVPGAIIAEASISWLGLFDPTIVSWGRMLYEFTGSGVIIRPISEYWFWVMPPGLAIMFLAIAFILVGYALDEILNPKLRHR